MVKKEWSDAEEVAAIQEYLKYKKFLDKGIGDKKDTWDKIVNAVNSKLPPDGKIKLKEQVKKKIQNICGKGLILIIFE